MLTLVLSLIGLGGLTLTIEDCKQLDAEGLRLELDLELGELIAASKHPFEVSVHCECELATISISDPVTHKQVSRQVVDSGPKDPDRARMMALSATRLFTASWLELTLADPAPGQTPPQQTLPEPEILAAVERHLEAEGASAPAPHEIGLELAGGWMGLVAGGAGGRFGLHYGHRVGRGFTLMLGPQLSAAGVRRDAGVAIAGTYALAAALRWELWSSADKALALRPTLSGGWQSLTSYRQVDAPGGGAGTRLGNTIGSAGLAADYLAGRRPRVRVGLAFEWIVGGPLGRAPDGDVAFAGPCAWLTLGLDWRLPDRAG